MKRQIACAYMPLILRNMTEICAHMGVGRETVKAWLDMGAPISAEKDGAKTRYSAEAMQLQNWRFSQNSQPV